MSSTQDVRFSTQPIEEGRRLANKLWNASRLLLMSGSSEVDERPSSLEERWILARLDATRAEVERDFDAFDFAHAADRLYHLTFDDFCDWYLESIKPRLAEPDVQATALAALERLLKLLHPLMPHVTEEIWSHLPARASRLIVAPWPEAAPDYEAELNALDQAQTAARIYRRSGVRINVAAMRSGSSRRSCGRPRTARATSRASARGSRRRSQRAEKMLANERFVANAAPDVVEAERLKLEQYKAELDALGD